MNASILPELLRVARIATVLVDGDEASRIITDNAMFHLAHEDAKFRFLTLDHYDVDLDTFLRMKKLLLRLERLSPVECCASLWVPVPATGRMTLALQNGNVNRYYEFGQKTIALPEAMRTCLDRGEPVELAPDEKRSVYTVLTPLFDSLEDPVAVLELSSAEGPTGEYA
jgi:hypothetical protein